MYNLFRYFLGTFYESVHFQLLTGIKIGYQREPFWPIFLAITLLLSGVAFLSVNLKKMKERYRDRKFLQKININIRDATGAARAHKPDETPTMAAHPAALVLPHMAPLNINIKVSRR